MNSLKQNKSNLKEIPEDNNSNFNNEKLQKNIGKFYDINEDLEMPEEYNSVNNMNQNKNYDIIQNNNDKFNNNYLNFFRGYTPDSSTIAKYGNYKNVLNSLKEKKNGLKVISEENSDENFKKNVNMFYDINYIVEKPKKIEKNVYNICSHEPYKIPIKTLSKKVFVEKPNLYNNFKNNDPNLNFENFEKTNIF